MNEEKERFDYSECDVCSNSLFCDAPCCGGRFSPSIVKTLWRAFKNSIYNKLG